MAAQKNITKQSEQFVKITNVFGLVFKTCNLKI